ncbi:MAG: hypothetical protein AAFR52_14915 [Pseudomonadota bacterium]
MDFFDWRKVTDEAGDASGGLDVPETTQAVEKRGQMYDILRQVIDKYDEPELVVFDDLAF